MSKYGDIYALGVGASTPVFFEIANILFLMNAMKYMSFFPFKNSLFLRRRDCSHFLYGFTSGKGKTVSISIIVNVTMKSEFYVIFHISIHSDQ